MASYCRVCLHPAIKYEGVIMKGIGFSVKIIQESWETYPESSGYVCTSVERTKELILLLKTQYTFRITLAKP